MIAVLIGSTGLTGSLLVRRLLADSAIGKVVSVSRRSLQIANAKLTEVLIADLSELASLASRIRGDLFFCCLGTTIRTAGSKQQFERVDHAAVVAFATIAGAHHATSFTLVSAMGANARSMVFYNRVKGRTEDDLQALNLRSLIIFRPALLVGSRHEFRLAEAVATRTLVPVARLLPLRYRKSVLTEADALAEHMLAKGKAAPEGRHVILAKDI